MLFCSDRAAVCIIGFIKNRVSKALDRNVTKGSGRYFTTDGLSPSMMQGKIFQFPTVLVMFFCWR